VLPFGPVSPHRISAAKGQHKVNEARGRAEIPIDRACGRHPRLAITTGIVVRTANTASEWRDELASSQTCRLKGLAR
jgi:hypothetical protein